MNKEIYRNTVEFQVSGDYALFSDILTRPGGEKMSYPIPTYEALKGILSSVYWKPTIIWVIDSVRVMNRIRSVRKGIRPLKYGGGIDLSYYSFLHTLHIPGAGLQWILPAVDPMSSGHRSLRSYDSSFAPIISIFIFIFLFDFYVK